MLIFCNSLLDELDEDLLLELDQVVRDNQLAYLPFARSGRAEAMLFEKYPELVERIGRTRQAKIDAIVLSNKYAAADGRATTSFRAQSLEEVASSPSFGQKARRKSRDVNRSEPESPSITPTLKGKASAADLMFDMSDGDDDALRSTRKSPTGQDQFKSLDDLPGTGAISPNRTERVLGSPSPHDAMSLNATPSSFKTPPPPRSSARPWGTAPLVANKIDLKDVLAQGSAGPSNLSLGLFAQAAQAKREEKISGSFSAKISQKERKRLQQAQQQVTNEIKSDGRDNMPELPWQTAGKLTKELSTTVVSQKPAAPQPARTASTPQLTIRQTLARTSPAATPKFTPASPQRTPQQQRTVSGSFPSPAESSTAPKQPATPGRPTSSSSSKPIATPHSIRHTPLPQPSFSSPTQGLSIKDILSQQQAEKDYVKDAVAKRSLQDIQQEQEFQEWWDAESKRVMEEEEQRKRTEMKAVRGGRGGRGGKSGGAKKGKQPKEKAENETAKANEKAKQPKDKHKAEGGTANAKDKEKVLHFAPAASAEASTSAGARSNENSGKGGRLKGGSGRGGRGGAASDARCGKATSSQPQPTLSQPQPAPSQPQTKKHLHASAAEFMPVFTPTPASPARPA